MKSLRQTYYDLFSKIYDFIIRFHSRDIEGSLRSFIAEKANLTKGDRALGLCTGTGSVDVVGHFPWIPKLKGEVKNLWVFEQRVREGDLPAEEAERILPQCDVVGITGTSFINHTLEGLLKRCKEAYVVLIGPTTPLSPFLFDHGIDAICGVKVIDAEKVIRQRRATFKEVTGVRLLTLSKR